MGLTEPFSVMDGGPGSKDDAKRALLDASERRAERKRECKFLARQLLSNIASLAQKAAAGAGPSAG
jgi:hypothetical protein